MCADNVLSVDVEARSRLLSVLEVLEHEARALEGLGDARLASALRAMSVARAEIVAAVSSLEKPPRNGEES